MAASFSELLKKDMKLRCRMYKMYLAEIGIIILMSIFIVLNPFCNENFLAVNIKEIGKTMFFDQQKLDSLTILSNLLNLKSMKFSIAYTPNNTLTSNLMERVKNRLQIKNITAFNTESEMENKFDQRITLAGVVLHSYTSDETPSKLNISIRFPGVFRTWSIGGTFQILWIARCSGILDALTNNQSNQIDLYLREGFLQLQEAIFNEWYKDVIKDNGGTFISYSVVPKSFRHISFEEHCNLSGELNVGETLAYFMYLLPFVNIIWILGRQIQANLQSHHLHLGYSIRSYWLSNFIVSYVSLIPHIIIMIIILKIHWTNMSTGRFYDANIFYMTIFMLIFIAALVLNAICVIYLTHNATYGVLFGIAFWLACYGMMGMLMNQVRTFSLWLLLALLLFFNNSFAFGLYYLNERAHQLTIYDDFLVNIAILLNILICLLILDLLMSVHPGRYLDKKKMHITKFYRAYIKKKIVKPSITFIGEIRPVFNNYENSLPGGEEYVVVKNVSISDKKNKGKMTLINITMRIYKGEITVIYGAHGSSKTSLIAALAGWCKPDSGYIDILSNDLYKDWKTARHYISVVMPNNALYDLLTWQETLQYFIKAKMRVGQNTQAQLEFDKWIRILKPIMSETKYVKNLSFSRKRILCLCCALCADTKVILLDQPAIHLRNKEQEFFYNLLMKEKPERAIIITTVLMQDADLFGDRIAILTYGAVSAYGSSFFLKKRFNIGFDLIIIKSPDAQTVPITILLRKFFPEIRPDNEIGDQIVYKIPNTHRSQFQHMLLQLEMNSNYLGITDIRMFSNELHNILDSFEEAGANQLVIDNTDHVTVTYLSQAETKKQQTRAIYLKRMLHQPPIYLMFAIILIVLALILYITLIISLINIPPIQVKGMQLGMNLTNNTLLDGYMNCKCINIKHLHENVYTSELNELSKTFTNESFECCKPNFSTFVKTIKKAHRTLGAVEFLKITSSSDNEAEDNNNPFINVLNTNAVDDIVQLDPLMLLNNWMDDTTFNVTTVETTVHTTDNSIPLLYSTTHRQKRQLINDNSNDSDNDNKNDSVTVQPTVNTIDDDSTKVPNKLNDASISENDDNSTKDDFDVIAQIWINQKKFHSAAYTLNLFHNYLLKKSFQNSSKYIVTITNDPTSLPLKNKMVLISQHVDHIKIPIIIGIIIPLTLSVFVCTIVDERLSQFLHILMIAGLPIHKYWFINFIWDYLTLLVYFLIYILFLIMISITSYDMTSVLYIYVLLCIFAVPGILKIYAISIFFQKKSTPIVFLKTIVIEMLTGLVPFIIYWDVVDNSIYWYILFAWSPSFILLDGINNLNTIAAELVYCVEKCDRNNLCSTKNICDIMPLCCDHTRFKMEQPGIILHIFLMILSSVLYIVILFIAEVRKDVKKFHARRNIKSLKSACYEYDDMEVVEMKKQIAEADIRECREFRLFVDQLENKVPKGETHLHTVSFSIPRRTSLSIYGPPHCGKSHLVRQIVRLDPFEFGEVYLRGKDMKHNAKEAFTLLGYCPQQDGVINTLKIRDILNVIAITRAVPPIIISDLIDNILTSLNLKKIQHRKIDSLSVSQKRKVNIAISFIAYNKIIVMDEPTKGLTHHSRREIWNFIRYSRFRSKSFLIISTDAEECMVLSDKTILYEDNEMLATGSMQHLLSRYTYGFYLEIKILREGNTVLETEENLYKDIENLKRFVSFLHGESELIRRIDTTLLFYLPVPVITFSYLYGSMEKNRRRLNIVDYLISQGKLSHILKKISSKRTHPKILLEKYINY